MSTRKLYVLDLTEGRKYVGVTRNLASRYAAHACGRATDWTKIYPPLRIASAHDVPEESAQEEELRLTVQLMLRHGLNHVRGACLNSRYNYDARDTSLIVGAVRKALGMGREDANQVVDKLLRRDTKCGDHDEDVPARHCEDVEQLASMANKMSLADDRLCSVPPGWRLTSCSNGESCSAGKAPRRRDDFYYSSPALGRPRGTCCDNLSYCNADVGCSAGKARRRDDDYTQQYYSNGYWRLGRAPLWTEDCFANGAAGSSAAHMPSSSRNRTPYTEDDFFALGNAGSDCSEGARTQDGECGEPDFLLDDADFPEDGHASDDVVYSSDDAHFSDVKRGPGENGFLDSRSDENTSGDSKSFPGGVEDGNGSGNDQHLDASSVFPDASDSNDDGDFPVDPVGSDGDLSSEENPTRGHGGSSVPGCHSYAERYEYRCFKQVCKREDKCPGPVQCETGKAGPRKGRSNRKGFTAVVDMNRDDCRTSCGNGKDALRVEDDGYRTDGSTADLEDTAEGQHSDHDQYSADEIYSSDGY